MYNVPIAFTEEDRKLIRDVELHLYRGRKCPSGPALAPLIERLFSREKHMYASNWRWKNYARRLRFELKMLGVPVPNVFLAWREARKGLRAKVLAFVAEQRRAKGKEPR